MRNPAPQPAALTPAMQSVLERAARVRSVPLYQLAPPQARAAYDAAANVLALPNAPMARVQDLQIPGRDGHLLPARLFAPSHGMLPTLLFMHGGGFTIGSVSTHEPLCRELARLSGCAVLSLDYRLAPEHPFPSAVHDTWDALTWLRDNAAVLGLDTQRFAVGGDSAGGTLAATAAVYAARQGWPLALQLLVYPGCGARADTPSHHTYAQGYILEQAHIAYFFNHYIPDLAQREDWRFAPLNADLTALEAARLAPAWFGLAECDPLVDEGIAYADKLRAAGVAVDLEIYRGVVHGFINWGQLIPEARQLHTDAATALRCAFETN